MTPKMLSLTVSQLNEYVRRTLQMDPMLRGIELKGEISNLKFHQTGAMFFTMKDSQASIPCVMYAQDVQGLCAEPFEGMQTVVSGSVSLYVRSGQYQFVARTLRAQGVGVLYEQFIALKEKLLNEGLFRAERKKTIPNSIDTLGVVTSPTGAVIHDILNVSLRRDPQTRLLLCPVRVQGMGASQEVVHAIHLLEQMPAVSVIIVARGGGSMEDLWTFNEENVVRAVAECTKPIVSAVGHETDVTLCDLASDLRVPTPSAAAECVVPLRAQKVNALSEQETLLYTRMQAVLGKKRMQLLLMQERLRARHPSALIAQNKQKLLQAEQILRRAVMKKLDDEQMRLEQNKRELELLSPYQVLSRGYALVVRQGQAVSSSDNLHTGDSVTLRFADGSVQADITHDGKMDREEENNGSPKEEAIL